MGILRSRGETPNRGGAGENTKFTGSTSERFRQSAANGRDRRPRCDSLVALLCHQTGQHRTGASGYRSPIHRPGFGGSRMGRQRHPTVETRLRKTGQCRRLGQRTDGGVCEGPGEKYPCGTRAGERKGHHRLRPEGVRICKDQWDRGDHPLS